jgi:V8-like Glu-specific endopeptidase
MHARIAVAALLLLLVSSPVRADGPFEINTTLMRSTFKVAGTGSAGTAFILGRRDVRDANKAHYVLVTAAHVLNKMQTDDAVLFLRKKDGAGFQKIAFPIKVKKNGRPLWTTHPDADVAVMYVALPTEADLVLLSTDLLATDEVLEKFSIHPGDQLSCLGFPYGADANDAGFPVLRTGHIASYPLTPTKKTKVLLFDFNVFEGNSGGPVYFVDRNRTFGGTTNLGTTIQFLVGLVSQQSMIEEEVKSMSETRRVQHQLGIGIVIHASLIREALDLLPAPKD